MINKKHTSLLPVGVVSVISKYVNQHSSWRNSFMCYNNENSFMNGRRLAGIHYIDVHIVFALCKSEKCSVCNDLNIIENNPSQRKGARDAASKVLDKFDYYLKTSKAYNNKKSTSSRESLQPQQQGQGGITLNQNDNNTNNITQVYDSTVGKKRRADDTPDEVDQFFNNRESSRTQQDRPSICLKGADGVCVIPTSNHYNVKNGDSLFNVTTRFQDLQRQAIDIANNTGFILETNIELLLSLSSILLTRPGQYSDDLLLHIQEDELNAIHDDIMTMLAGNKYDETKFDRSIKNSIEDIIDSLLQRNGDRMVAIADLAKLLTTSSKYESKLILALISLVQKLPPYPLISPLGEIKLCCQYLDPILFSLFNDYKSKVNFRWPNLTLRDEAAHDVESSRRPDATMSIIIRNTFGENRGYGEAKTSQNNSNYDLTRELVRINAFSKQSIDLASMGAVMGFQAVGNHVTFSVLVLVKDGVYFACDIAAMDFPCSLPDIKSFLPMLDKLLLVSHIYEKCIPSPTHVPVE